MKMRRNRSSIAEKTICLKKKTYLKYAEKFDSESTHLYKNILKFFSGKSEKPGKIAIIRIKMRRNRAAIAQKTMFL